MIDEHGLACETLGPPHAHHHQLPSLPRRSRTQWLAPRPGFVLGRAGMAGRAGALACWLAFVGFVGLLTGRGGC